MKGWKILLALGIVGMFIIPMMPAKEPETNYVDDAKNLLQNWESKLSTEGATAGEVKEIIQKMEVYKQILENEIKSKESEKLGAKEIIERLDLITQLELRIELEKYFLKECERAKEEYKKGDIKFNFEIPEILSTSFVYPTGRWKKWERTTGAGGIYAADYNVNEKKGYVFSRSDNYNSGYGESGLYWETWWGDFPVHWQVRFYTQYFGYSSGHVTFVGPDPGGIPLGWCDVYNGIKVKEVKSGIGVYFYAYTSAWGLADMEINHYLPQAGMCWQLDRIQITTL